MAEQELGGDAAPQSVKKGLLLDIGCGGRKQSPLWVGIDKRPLPGVDIVHDLEVFPWPIESDSVITSTASHVIEHIKPWLTLDFFNEIWRVMKVGGQFAFAAPYGVGAGYVQDPTHCNPFNEATFLYFDPRPAMLGWNEAAGVEGQFNVFYDIYKPKPWLIQNLYFQQNGNIEGILVKRAEENGS